MVVSRGTVSIAFRLLALLFCAFFSHGQDEYSGFHSGDEHTYEGSLVDSYDPSGYPHPAVEYPPEPTHSYEEQQPSEYDPYAPAPTGVTMITEESYPYATTTESHYAKKDVIITSKVPYDSEENDSGEDTALGQEGPTECDCEPGEPGFAGFAGPKGGIGLQGKQGFQRQGLLVLVELQESRGRLV